jgi:hypothetical protein
MSGTAPERPGLRRRLTRDERRELGREILARLDAHRAARVPDGTPEQLELPGLDQPEEQP